MKTITKKNINILTYRADIDGLRALAIWAVVIFHAFPNILRSGFVGVDIFFVISGFLISSIIIKNLQHNNFSFLDFYIKRINRIFPALLIVLISCLIFGYFLLLPDEYQQIGKHVAGGASFISNILLWQEVGYFNTSSDVKPLLNLWSLGIEEQFYILWPLLLFCIWKINIKPLIIIFLIFCISFFLQLYSVKKYPEMTFYLIHTRAWELLIGAVWAYYSTIKTEAINANARISKQFISALGVLLLLLGFIFIKPNMTYPKFIGLLPTIGAILLIMAGSEAWFNKHILSNKVCVWFGLISYPLYLWHWPILSFLRIIKGDNLTTVTKLGAILLSVILAILTFYLIEKPLKRITSKLKSLYLLLCMLIVGCVGLSIYMLNGLPSRGTIQETSTIYNQFVGPLWKYTNNDLCMNRYPFEPSKKYGWWFCMINNDKAPDILLAGNSYANHLYPGIIENSELKKYTVLSIGTCSFGQPDINPDGNNPCSGNNVLKQQQFIKSIIDKNPSIKFVILDGLASKQNKQTIGRLKDFIGYLESHNIQPIVFIPHITIKHDLKLCVSRPLRSNITNCTVDIKQKDSIDETFKPLIIQINKDYPDVVFFDQNKLFCKDTTCSFILNGMPAFRDEYSHYSEYASKELINMFVDWYNKNTSKEQKPL